MAEAWKDIEGYEGLYQISSNGRLKALSKQVFPSTHPWRIRSYPERIVDLLQNECGYNFYYLSKGGTSSKRTIHRLVAKAFMANPLNKPHVNHKNGNKIDNNISNLEWATPKENMVHARRNGLIKCGENAANAKLTNKQAEDIRNSVEGPLALSKKYNVTQTIIINIRQNKTYMPNIYFGELPAIMSSRY